jgi:hypothetical protein
MMLSKRGMVEGEKMSNNNNNNNNNVIFGLEEKRSKKYFDILEVVTEFLKETVELENWYSGKLDQI